MRLADTVAQIGQLARRTLGVRAAVPRAGNGPSMASSAPVFQAPPKSSAVAGREPMWANQAKNVSRSTPIGSPGTLIRGGRISNEEWNPKLENEHGYGEQGAQGVYDEMRKTDPDIRRALQLLKLPLLSARYMFEAASDSDLDKEIATFCEYVFFERNPWKSSILPQSLTMFDFGASIFEVTEAVQQVPRTRFPNLPHMNGPGRPGETETVDAVLPKLSPRPMKTIWRWGANPDDQEKLGFVVQKLNGDDTTDGGFRVIPSDRVLRFTHEQEAGNFGGTSALRYVYKPWRYADRLERTDVVRHERQNNGTPVMKLPKDGTGILETDVDKAEKILKSVGQSEKGYVVEPPGWEFRWETSGDGTGTNVGDAILRYKRAIADALLAGFMTLGNGDTGSYALAITQAELFLLSVEAHAKFIEDVWNNGVDGWSIVERLVTLNYGPRAEYPKLKVADLKSKNYIALLEAVGTLVRFGVIKPSKSLEQFALEKLDLPDNDDETDEEEDIREDPGKASPDEPPPVSGTGAGVKPAPAPPPGTPNPNPNPAPATPPAGGQNAP